MSTEAHKLRIKLNKIFFGIVQYPSEFECPPKPIPCGCPRNRFFVFGKTLIWTLISEVNRLDHLVVGAPVQSQSFSASVASKWNWGNSFLRAICFFKEHVVPTTSLASPENVGRWKQLSPHVCRASTTALPFPNIILANLKQKIKQ